MNAILDALVARLPLSVQPYAKALVPVVVALVALVGQVAIGGQGDVAEVATAAGGAVTSLLVLAVPNR